MLSLTDFAGIALVITALGTFLIAVGTTINMIRIGRVHDEVKTLNESTIGQLAAAGETARVEDIPHDKRTAQEQRHLDTAPIPEPPQGPSR